MNDARGADEQVSAVEVCRVNADGSAERQTDSVIVEQVVTVMVDEVGSFTLMCTPADVDALAVGFIFAEGMIDSMDDVLEVSINENLPNVVGIELDTPSGAIVKRNLIVASSCGLCGARNIEKLLSDIPACADTLRMDLGVMFDVVGQLRGMQPAFHVTGGSHAAAIFRSSGELIASAEDLGRHSALDKAIGKCLMNRQSMKSCGVALSGRISLEMVTKAARAGLELIAAVSAPSSFAIEAARDWDITLCGFVRAKAGNVYTHPRRITDLETACK